LIEVVHSPFEENWSSWRNLNLVAAGEWVCCKKRLALCTLKRVFAENDPNLLIRALGTPLEWPEAKKEANRVRTWGIEVRHT
jgi:hypothetical protein